MNLRDLRMNEKIIHSYICMIAIFKPESVVRSSVDG